MRAALALLLIGCGTATSAPAPGSSSPSPREGAGGRERASEPTSEPATVPVAVTIDDLPWVGATLPNETPEDGVRRILAAAAEHGAPLAGFFTCSRWDGREAARDVWLAQPIELGNHSTSHRALDDLGLDGWRRDVSGCQRRLTEAAGRDVPWFRYPYLRTGSERALRDAGFAYLEELGLRRAPVTIDTSDWALVAPYVDARREGDDALAEQILDAYVGHVRRSARRYVALAEERGHAGAPQVLLLHANALAADGLGRVLEALAADGLRFGTLTEAMSDPLYTAEDHYVGGTGLSWLYRIDPDGAPAWAWDAAQLHALQVRFTNERERESYDLDANLTVRRVADDAWEVSRGGAASRVTRRPHGAIELRGPGPTGPSVIDWIAARFRVDEVTVVEH